MTAYLFSTHFFINLKFALKELLDSNISFREKKKQVFNPFITNLYKILLSELPFNRLLIFHWSELCRLLDTRVFGKLIIFIRVHCRYKQDRFCRIVAKKKTIKRILIFKFSSLNREKEKEKDWGMMAVSKETLYIIIFNIVNSLFFSLRISFFFF